jgi:hypothetical protein
MKEERMISHGYFCYLQYGAVAQPSSPGYRILLSRYWQSQEDTITMQGMDSRGCLKR